MPRELVGWLLTSPHNNRVTRYGWGAKGVDRVQMATNKKGDVVHASKVSPEKEPTRLHCSTPHP